MKIGGYEFTAFAIDTYWENKPLFESDTLNMKIN